MYIHLHGHSHYSLLEAIGKPKDIVAKAKELGMTSIAITDYNGMYGAVGFYQACEKADIKPLIGVDIALVHDYTNKESKKEHPGYITLLAKNYEGYLALLELVSKGNMEGFHEKPRIDFGLLQQYSQHLIGYMGGVQSYLGHMILSNEPQNKLEEVIRMLTGYFGENNFLLELTVQDETDTDIKKINQTIVDLSKSSNTTLICNNNYHYIHQEDKKAFEVALSIKDGKRVYDEDRRKVQGEQYIMSETEIINIMENNGYEREFVAELFATNQAIADSIDIQLPLGTILFPKYESNPEIAKKYEEMKHELIEKR